MCFAFFLCRVGSCQGVDSFLNITHSFKMLQCHWSRTRQVVHIWNMIGGQHHEKLRLRANAKRRQPAEKRFFVFCWDSWDIISDRFDGSLKTPCAR